MERSLLPIATAFPVAILLVALIVWEVRRYGRRRKLNEAER
jgi:hypothetical protein